MPSIESLVKCPNCEQLVPLDATCSNCGYGGDLTVAYINKVTTPKSALDLAYSFVFENVEVSGRDSWILYKKVLQRAKEIENARNALNYCSLDRFVNLKRLITNFSRGDYFNFDTEIEHYFDELFDDFENSTSVEGSEEHPYLLSSKYYEEELNLAQTICKKFLNYNNYNYISSHLD